MLTTEQLQPLTHYARLGVSRGAQPEEIRKAYLRAALIYHPDKNPPESSQGAFGLISESYEHLSGNTHQVHDDEAMP